MRRSPTPIPSPRLVTLAALAAVVTALYFARGVVIPLALATLLSFVLAPLVARLERWGLRRALAVALVGIAACIPLASVAWAVADQFSEQIQRLPTYKVNIQSKLLALRGREDGALQGAMRTLQELGHPGEPAAAPSDPASSANPPQAPPAASPLPQPLPVTVVEHATGPVQLLRNLVGPIVRPLATTGIVLVFVIFMLMQREDLRNRAIRLISRHQITTTTQAIDEAAERVSRFLRLQLIVNAGYGVIVAVGLSFIGVPGGVLWGCLAGLFRFIPFAGPVLGAGIPILLAVATQAGWTVPALTAGFFITLEVIVGNLLEPWLYGSTTGVSSLALLVAAVFWTWLWGAPGLLLSTPMTVCLLVLGRHMPALEFLSVLLGDEPPLSPRARLYQRLVAMDQDEAMSVAEEYLKDHPLVDLYETMFIPVLRLADEARQDGALDEDRRRFIDEAMRDMVDDIAARAPPPTTPRVVVPAESPRPPLLIQGAPARVAPPPTAPDAPAAGPRVLCIPARTEADAVAGQMLAVLLDRAGATTRVLTLDDLGSDLAQIAADFKPDFVCISAVPPSAVAQAGRRCKLVRRRLPDATVLVGVWGLTLDPPRTTDRLLAAGADAVVATLTDVVDHVQARPRAQTARPAA
jgi:predicted PurR-regulated permease PerM